MQNNKIKIDQDFLSLDETIRKIQNDEVLVIAADESFLSKLPTGNWIAGTIPYFMAKEGGVQTTEKAFVHSIIGNSKPKISMYSSQTIDRIANDSPDSGFTIVILPAGSKVHSAYAENAPIFEGMFDTPIVGWVSGFELNNAKSKKPKTMYGLGKHLSDEHAVALHVPIPQEQVATISIINTFSQGEGPTLTFPETGFNIGKCFVDGKEFEFTKFLKDFDIDTQLPMVADYNGTGVNVSIQSIDESKNEAVLYAPIFKGVKYRFPDPRGSYEKMFKDAIIGHNDTDKSQFSVNCILNYLYSGLEGKKISELVGPITFGEVAYQLLNQTAVYLTIEPSV